MDTGSVTNHILGISTKGQPTPDCGMGATLLHWTDRSPATIIEVKGKTIRVQEDDAERVDNNGMSESQTYVFSRNPAGQVTVFTLRKNGAWVRKGEPMKGGSKVRIGDRDKYHDFSF